jgi:hypothetical protein
MIQHFLDNRLKVGEEVVEREREREREREKKVGGW